MRNLINLLIASLIAISACKSNRTNEEVFSQFEGESGVYIVKLPPMLFLGLLGVSGDNVDSEKLGDIDYVKLMIHSPEEESRENVESSVFTRLKTSFSESAYENVVGYSSGSTYVSAYLLEKEEYVSDLMILFKEGNSVVCLGLSGKINGDAIVGLASEIEYEKLRDFVDSK